MAGVLGDDVAGAGLAEHSRIEFCRKRALHTDDVGRQISQIQGPVQRWPDGQNTGIQALGVIGNLSKGIQILTACRQEDDSRRVAQDFDGFADGMDGDVAGLVLTTAAPALDAAVRDADGSAGLADIGGHSRRIGMGRVDDLGNGVFPDKSFHLPFIHAASHDGHERTGRHQGSAIGCRHRHIGPDMIAAGILSQFPPFCRTAGNP